MGVHPFGFPRERIKGKNKYVKQCPKPTNSSYVINDDFFRNLLLLNVDIVGIFENTKCSCGNDDIKFHQSIKFYVEKMELILKEQVGGAYQLLDYNDCDIYIKNYLYNTDPNFMEPHCEHVIIQKDRYIYQYQCNRYPQVEPIYGLLPHRKFDPWVKFLNKLLDNTCKKNLKCLVPNLSENSENIGRTFNFVRIYGIWPNLNLDLSVNDGSILYNLDDVLAFSYEKDVKKFWQSRMQSVTKSSRK